MPARVYFMKTVNGCRDVCIFIQPVPAAVRNTGGEGRARLSMIVNASGSSI